MDNTQNKNNQDVLTEQAINLAKKELKISLDQLSKTQQQLLSEVLSSLEIKIKKDKQK